MPNFALYNESIIENVIIAEDQETAETLSGMSAILTEGSPWIGWTWLEDKWAPPQPFHSWEWNGEEWAAPIPMPETDGPWIWNEELGNWEEVIPE